MKDSPPYGAMLTLRCVLSLGCAVLLSSASAAATYYVATNGNDSDAGTEAHPWKTPRKAAASVQPGDTVRIRAGEYFVGPTWIVNRAGTAENPITYKSYGDGEVRITGSSVLPAKSWRQLKNQIYSAPVSGPVLAVFRDNLPLYSPGGAGRTRPSIASIDDLFPGSYFISEGTLYVWLEDGSDPGHSVIRTAPGHAISLYDCHHTILDGLTVEYGFNGIKDQGKATHDIIIRNCTIRSIASQGIQPVARNSIIENNLFQKIGLTKFEHGIYCSQPAIIIRSNVFEEISGAGIHQFHQGDPPAGGGCEFSGNVFRKPRKMIVGPGQDGYYTDIIAWGEGSHRIFNNTFHGEGKRSGISLNSVSNQVCNNRFVGSACAIQFHSGKAGNLILSNIIQEATRSFLIWPANTLPQKLDYNIFYNAAAAPRWERDGKSFQTFAAYQKEAGESHSRYDSELPSRPELPDPLVMMDGRRVTTSEQWFKERRPELIRLFQHYMYGKLPPHPTAVSSKLEREDRNALGGKATLKEVTITFGPAELAPIHLMLIVPNQRQVPAPVVLGLNYFGNHTLVRDPAVALSTNWMPERGEGVVNNHSTEASRGTWVDIWRIEYLIERGYALATCYNGDIDPDRPDGRGIQTYFQKLDPSNDCATVAAWAWGLQRAVDYLVRAPDIDPHRIIVTGHSRLGKAALLAAAFDERIALAIPHQAGSGGSAPSRTSVKPAKMEAPAPSRYPPKPPETVFNLNDKFPHWFNARFKEFNTQPERLPFDQHCLVALCAPRPVLFTNGREDTWINPAGQFEVLRGAAPVYRLLGAGDFTATELPPNGKLIYGTLGYFLRPGAHSLRPEDWKAFLDFADKQLGPPEKPRTAAVAREQGPAPVR